MSRVLRAVLRSVPIAVVIATGSWLLVFALWDGWPEGQLMGASGLLAGIGLVAVSLQVAVAQLVMRRRSRRPD